MPGKQHTLILVPHKRAKLRKWRISSAQIIILLTFALALPAATVASIIYATYLGDEGSPPDQEDLVTLEREFKESTAQMRLSLRNADTVINRLVEESRNRERELQELRSRHQALLPIVEGQEEVARAYRQILKRRSLAERLGDIGASLLVGIAATLLAGRLLRKQGATIVLSAEDREKIDSFLDSAE